MQRTGIACLLALAWLHPKPALAADAANCSLKLVNTVPIKMAYEGRRVVVPVTINGTEKSFLLDTGGWASQISAATAEELKLLVVDSGIKMLDVYGNVSTKAAKVDMLVLGRLKDPNAWLPVTTSDDESLFSGLLAADYMGKYDIELDFAGGKMNYFSPDHCEGKVVYWPAAAIAAVPMRFTDHHMHLDVTLDGHNIKAMIDTGAPQTTLDAAEAKRIFALAAENANAADKHGEAFEHVFQKLSFEGMEVSNPHVLILPERVGTKDPNNSLVTGTRLKRVDDQDPSELAMLIGMNILSKLHLYIAFKEQMIYITPASQPRPQ